MKRRLALLPALVLLAGCPSFSTMGTARTLPRGKGQFFVAPGGMVLQDFQQDSAGQDQSFGLPSVEFGGRYGVTDDVEVGAKVWLLGAEIDTKFALLRSPSADAGLDVSLAPAISLYPFSAGDQNVTYAWVHLPLLVGVNLGGSQLVVGPRVSGMFLTGSGDDVSALWLGGSLGYAWKLADGFRILPEVSVAYPAHVSFGTSSTTSLEPKGALIQGSVGLLFGGD
jgi:hypothetical protein